MKRWILLVAALLISVVALVVSWTGRGPNIAYAETATLFSEFTESIQARKEFETAQKEWDKNLTILNDSLSAAMEHMKARYDQASPQERIKLRRLLERRDNDLQRYTQAVKQMATEKETTLMEPVVKKINSFMAIWGKEHGYDLILGTQAGGNILQAHASLNVTAALLRDLNEHYRDLPARGTQPVPPKAAPVGTPSAAKK